MSFQPPTTTHNSAACAVIALGSNLAHGGESPAQIVIEAAKTPAVALALRAPTVEDLFDFSR